MLAVVLSIYPYDACRRILLGFHLLVMEYALGKHLEENLAISTPSSDKVSFGYRLELLANHLLIVSWLCLALFIGLL